jgi:peptide/nickel transport system permease protein
MAIPISRFITRRVFQAVPLLLLVSGAVFALIHFIPGGPLTVFLSNPQVRPEDIARLQRSLGLDRPLAEQYLRSALGSGYAGCHCRAAKHSAPLILSTICVT